MTEDDYWTIVENDPLTKDIFGDSWPDYFDGVEAQLPDRYQHAASLTADVMEKHGQFINITQEAKRLEVKHSATNYRAILSLMVKASVPFIISMLAIRYFAPLSGISILIMIIMNTSFFGITLFYYLKAAAASKRAVKMFKDIYAA
ncbi:hypothetical protein [Alterisphingorhabdus coralli]|uniref:Uncharacterized protein n=1 Tax=Alterisphingorhabdus coralli TaxID=3071408 RepID=A0AA97I2S6_9SPHN|nr:hypothetical protein [Parasphingorhabdus sp. SCSIO 66989]WOE76725.1 hypothetical protein RB602_15175 [Parasphingorhabdus sp. SCSIO 66989]